MADEQVTPALAPKKSRAWLGTLLILILGLAGAGVFVWLRSQASVGGANAGDAESTLALETFVVNLNSAGQHGYLRLGISLGLARELPRNKAEAIPTALIRDTILSVLATAQAEQLLSSDGKRQLKDDLLKALQERVPQIGVQHVYFTEFLVQM